MDGLKRMKIGHHGGIIFDDMTFTHWPLDAQKHLTDMDFDSEINVKYSTVIIPRGTHKIITSNEHITRILNVFDKAIARRIEVWEVDCNTDDDGVVLPPATERIYSIKRV